MLCKSGNLIFKIWPHEICLRCFFLGISHVSFLSTIFKRKADRVATVTANGLPRGVLEDPEK